MSPHLVHDISMPASKSV